jgi:hypothetical protein
MPYRVFVSYSTTNLHIAQWAIQSLSRPGTVEVFVAEYSIAPGSILDEHILSQIRICDVFILLWSGAARQSDWVPQEIGAARMAGKTIVPVVLDPNLDVPGFISNVKYLRAYEDWQGSFSTLKILVEAQAAANQRQQAFAVVGLILGAIALISASNGT